MTVLNTYGNLLWQSAVQMLIWWWRSISMSTDSLIRKNEVQEDKLGESKGAKPVDLLLREGRILTIKFHVPEAAKPDLPLIVREHLLIHCPLPLDAVAYGYQTAQKDEGRLHVTVHLIKRTDAVSILQRAEGDNIQIRSLRFKGCIIDYEPLLELQAKKVMKYIGVGFGALILMTVSLNIVTYRLNAAKSKVDSEIVEKRQLSAGPLRQQQQILGYKKQYDFLKGQGSGPRIVAVFDALTKALDQESYVDEVRYAQGRLWVQGRSKDIPKQAKNIESLEMVEAAVIRSSSPVADSGYEQFEIEIVFKNEKGNKS